jgi:hypothetical protein
MPHLGQEPGDSLSTPSHIGQKYFFAGEGWEGDCPWP